MRAVWMASRGGPEVLRYGEIAPPVLEAGQVRIAVKAVALNHLDVWVRKGVASPKLPLPHILGCDIAGVVESVGAGVSGVAPGDAVVVNPGVSCGRCARCLGGQDNLCAGYQILGEHRWGGYAELVVVPAANILPKPARLSWLEAASLPLTFLTAWQMVVDKLQVRPGEDVLVMAAGAGVSVAAIQIAKLHGARVIATASSDEKLAQAKALGADEGVNYSQPDWYKEVRRLTGGKGADAVVDHTGAQYWEGVIKATAWGGRISLVGASSGYEATTPLSHIFYRQLSIFGSTMASKSRLFPILQFVAEGRLRPVIGATLPLSQAAEGHRLLEERRVFGKVVLEV
ncbi:MULTISPECIES: zinc-binding dehydrogenase [Meiothermus]|uniref:Alcohol dehydrogenase zinc-binding domain protein n=2 Tax=Meiothermus TaxID=65551 RepID=D3PNY1_MEIRD|nr:MULTISPECIES: zinc-binding dehydrogenase [Meiothermus]ADD29526.1 Alcohol dehydrogenase zinc-binding domain protein [Meiothermus ruber DSM 1279]AGK05021.1 Alcohol dehydrogenase zinc-binding domain-containing protein [Meiothermus ruber DSM 1279]MCL6529273.1 zinc-binding dehydrogenase [Meiothermus ruber]MCX7801886.1 zinc-binding dehydrogenase [Meiothermus ruber]RIH74878.1 alcohol dehydrogenase [Meiothermus taiwanensis]